MTKILVKTKNTDNLKSNQNVKLEEYDISISETRIGGQVKKHAKVNVMENRDPRSQADYEGIDIRGFLYNIRTSTKGVTARKTGHIFAKKEWTKNYMYAIAALMDPEILGMVLPVSKESYAVPIFNKREGGQPFQEKFRICKVHKNLLHGSEEELEFKGWNETGRKLTQLKVMDQLNMPIGQMQYRGLGHIVDSCQDEDTRKFVTGKLIMSSLIILEAVGVKVTDKELGYMQNILVNFAKIKGQGQRNVSNDSISTNELREWRLMFGATYYNQYDDMKMTQQAYTVGDTEQNILHQIYKENALSELLAVVDESFTQLKAVGRKKDTERILSRRSPRTQALLDNKLHLANLYWNTSLECHDYDYEKPVSTSAFSAVATTGEGENKTEVSAEWKVKTENNRQGGWETPIQATNEDAAERWRQYIKPISAKRVKKECDPEDEHFNRWYNYQTDDESEDDMKKEEVKSENTQCWQQYVPAWQRDFLRNSKNT